MFLFLISRFNKARLSCKLFVATQQQITTSFNNLFDGLISGGSLSAIQAEHRKNLDSVGMNTELLGSFFDALQTLISALSHETSSSSENEDICRKVDNYIHLSQLFLRSQPGLANIDSDPSIRADPANADFFNLYDQSIQYSLSIKNNPTDAATYFNSQTAEGYAYFITLMMGVSDRILNAN